MKHIGYTANHDHNHNLEYDPAHSCRIQGQAMMISNVKGQFAKVTGVLTSGRTTTTSRMSTCTFLRAGDDSRVRLATRPHNRFFPRHRGRRALKNVRPAWHNGGMSESSDRQRGPSRVCGLGPVAGRVGLRVRQDLIDRLDVSEVGDPPSRARHAAHRRQLDGRGEFTTEGSYRLGGGRSAVLHLGPGASHVAVAGSVFPDLADGEPPGASLPATRPRWLAGKSPRARRS